jgi:hypothetical protein
LALSTAGLGGGEFNGEFRLGSGNLGSALDWGRKNDSGDNWSDGGDSRLGSGDSGGVIGLGSGRFGCVFNLGGSDGQVVGLDAESSEDGGVGDTDFFTFWVDVSVAADLVAVAVVTHPLGVQPLLAYSGCANHHQAGVLFTNAKHLGKYAKLGPRISVITSKRMSPF